MAMKLKANVIEGSAVKTGGVTYIVPALPLKKIQQLRDKIARLGSIDEEGITASIEVVHVCLSRNYECTIDEVGDLLDVRNVRAFAAAISAESGLASVEEMGEALGGVTTNSTGTTSTVTSSPASPAGPSTT